MHSCTPTHTHTESLPFAALQNASHQCPHNVQHAACCCQMEPFGIWGPHATPLSTSLSCSQTVLLFLGPILCISQTCWLPPPSPPHPLSMSPPMGSTSCALHQQCGRPEQQLKSPMHLGSCPPPAFWLSAMLERGSLMPCQRWQWVPSRFNPLPSPTTVTLQNVATNPECAHGPYSITPPLTWDGLTMHTKHLPYGAFRLIIATAPAYR